jgi:hypothetical protein
LRGLSYTPAALPSLEVEANEDHESFEEDLDDIADEGLDAERERKCHCRKITVRKVTLFLTYT